MWSKLESLLALRPRKKLERLTNATLADATQRLIGDHLPEWLRDYRSPTRDRLGEFRGAFPGGEVSLAISVSAQQVVLRHLAFYLSVKHDAVESAIRDVAGPDGEVDSLKRTIWCYTENVGPGSPHWSYGIRGSWTLQDLSQFQAESRAIATFVKEVVVDYLQEHQDIRAVRQTLLEKPGHAQNAAPYQQILVIDRLLGRENQADQDIATLEERYHRSGDEYRRAFHVFRDRFVARRRP